jgi:hypothetical protein
MRSRSAQLSLPAGLQLSDNAQVGSNNLAGLPPWLERWLRRQITDYEQLHEEQRCLLGELGLTEGEVRLCHAWPGGHRRPGGRTRLRCPARPSRPLMARRRRQFPVAAGQLTEERAPAAVCRRLPTRLGRQLSTIDAWWNPPWPVSWQRAWWAARYHLTGLPRGAVWWPGALDASSARRWRAMQIIPLQVRTDGTARAAEPQAGCSSLSRSGNGLKSSPTVNKNDRLIGNRIERQNNENPTRNLDNKGNTLAAILDEEFTHALKVGDDGQLKRDGDGEDYSYEDEFHDRLHSPRRYEIAGAHPFPSL